MREHVSKYLLNLVFFRKLPDTHVYVSNCYYQNLICESLLQFSPPHNPELENSLFTREWYIFRPITEWLTFNFRIAATRQKRKEKIRERKMPIPIALCDCLAASSGAEMRIRQVTSVSCLDTKSSSRTSQWAIFPRAFRTHWRRILLRSTWSEDCNRALYTND